MFCNGGRLFCCVIVRGERELLTLGTGGQPSIAVLFQMKTPTLLCFFWVLTDPRPALVTGCGQTTVLLLLVCQHGGLELDVNWRISEFNIISQILHCRIKKKSSKTSVCEKDASVITIITGRKAHLLEQISWTLNVAGGSFHRTATYTLVILRNQLSANVALATKLTSVKTNIQRVFFSPATKAFQGLKLLTRSLQTHTVQTCNHMTSSIL